METTQNIDTPKNLGGRPMLFADPEVLNSLTVEYFHSCDIGSEVTELTKRGELVTYVKQRPYSVEGLADYLKCDPKTLRNYAKRDKFFPIISRAMNKIHMSWVEKGLTNDYNAKMAALCLAANTKQYNVTKHTEQTNILSIEDKLREAQRIAREEPQQITEHIEDAEYTTESS
ncbi:terminase small subunit [Pseudoalteromonas sp.]|uniref:terminase small subunit n=1 Tax=Pseudoalteromonas sp. TaxID=53249 RepID=UPI0026016CC7|nr:terminase small subunit [Pseudoalteromonas sp.]MCP4585345.1 hypothetical protein [Pseudoalteromonas sp.]